MPRIEEFNAPDLGLRPSEVGVESTAAAARRVNTAFNEAAELKKETGARFGQDIRVAGDVANDAIAHQEISRASASFSAIMAGKTREWEAISEKADPNDPTVAANFMGGLNNQLEQFRQGFLSDTGHAWADHHIEQFRTHMMNKTTSDRNKADSHVVQINAAQTTNNLANVVYADPSEVNIRHALGMSDGMIGGVVATSPTMTNKAGVKDQLTQKSAEAIVKAGVLGHISKTGEMPSWLSSPEYNKYVNVAELAQFQKQAQAQKRSDDLATRQAALLQKQETATEAKTAVSKNFSDNVSFDANGTPTVKPEFFKNNMEIETRYPGVATEEVKAMINWGRAMQKEHKETVTSDPDVRSDLYTRMLSAENPTTDYQILNAEAAGKLDRTDASVFLALHKSLEEKPLKGPLYETAIEAAKERVGYSVLADGKERFANAMAAFLPEYIKRVRTGTTQPNDLDLKDEKSFIRQSIQRFEPDPQTRMNGYILKNFGGGMPAPAAASLKAPPETILTEARAAIASGKSREAVIQRLKENGYSSGSL